MRWSPREEFRKRSRLVAVLWSAWSYIAQILAQLWFPDAVWDCVFCSASGWQFVLESSLAASTNRLWEAFWWSSRALASANRIRYRLWWRQGKSRSWSHLQHRSHLVCEAIRAGSNRMGDSGVCAYRSLSSEGQLHHPELAWNWWPQSTLACL